ncbi:MAG: BON domain-containing protein [Acidobacteria bacterium]|nr:BON domain-containing protein [Acidobacteriota bacterium]
MRIPVDYRDRHAAETGGYEDRFSGGGGARWSGGSEFTETPYRTFGARTPFGHDQDHGSEAYEQRGYNGASQAGMAGGGGMGLSYGGPYGSGPAGRSFAGRGPKGYRRSDLSIAEDVNERLTYDPDVDATDVNVAVKDGIVSLAGSVASRHQKHLAEDCAWQAGGVSDVENRLRVDPQSGVR